MRQFWIGILMLLLQTGWSQTVEEQFELANQAYSSKDYDIAIKGYESILAQAYQSAELYYNLANAYYRTNATGRAILNYERAARLAPRDKDIQHNLEFVNTQLQDEIEVLPAFFLRQWWNNMQQLLSSNSWAVLSLLLFWLGILGLVVWQLGKERRQRRQGFFAGFALVLLSLLPTLWAWSSAKSEQHSKQAILLVKETTLQSAPDAQSATIMELHEGIKLQLLDQINTWYKVRLPNGAKGWLPFKVLEEI